MMKNTIVALIVAILLVGMVFTQAIKSKTIKNNVISLNGIFDECGWVAIKVISHEDANLSLLGNGIEYANEYEQCYQFEIHFNPQTGQIGWHMNGEVAPPRFFNNYFQIKMGNINYSYYNIPYNRTGSWDVELRENYSFKAGTTWYIILGIYGSSVNAHWWLNTTDNVTFSLTNGTNIFSYEREDFFGNINVGFGKGTIMINGVKQIQIKHKLFGWFTTDDYYNGFIKIGYSNPDDEYKEQRIVTKKGNIIRHKGDFEYYLIPRFNIMGGNSGLWTFDSFMINMNYGDYHIGYYPNILLYGADVQLPE